MGGGSPRFRRDMQASNVEDEGVLFVEVSDPQSGKSFRFYDFEYTVALALDGRPLDAVAAGLQETNQLELTRDQLAAFADQLSALGFLDRGDADLEPTLGAPEEPAPAAETRGAAKAENRQEKREDRKQEDRKQQDRQDEDESAGFFPPLTAEETGQFEQPRILGEGDAAAEILGEAGRPPEALPPTPPPAATRIATPKLPPVATRIATPKPPPATPKLPAAAKPLAPLGRPAEPPPRATSPPPRPAPPARPGAPTPPGGAPVPAAARPPLPSTNGAQLPADLPTPRLDPGLGQSGRRPSDPGLPAYAAAAAVVPAPPVAPPAPTADEPPSANGAREPLRLVPPTGVGMPTPEHEVEDNPEVFGTGSPEFPPPSPDQDQDPVHRMDLSMTRRFITPDRAKPARGPRPVWLAYAALGLAAAVVVAVMTYNYLTTQEPAPVSVRVVVPSPTSVYRWWDVTAPVTESGGTPLGFARDGKVVEIVASGSRFSAGDVLGMLDSAKPFRAEVNHNKSRLAYYEQMRETMLEQENRVKLREAELKIAEKKRLIAEAQANFAGHAIVATQAGEVGEALVQRGATAKAGEPAVRLKSSGYRATFVLPRADAEKARQLGFCRVEIDGKPLDCSLAVEGGDDTHVVIELPSDPGLRGKTVRLARDRLDAVFSVPTSALVKVGSSDRLFVVASPSGRAEMRVVAVADRGPGGATVTQGLDVGDRVIIDVPQGLRPDARVLISNTVSQ